MPDDRPYAQKQSDHALKLKAERVVMDMTGASRSQIRERFGRQIADSIQRQRELEKEDGKEKRPPPEVKVTSTAMPSSSGIGVGGGAADIASPPGFGTPVPETQIISNGSLFIATVLCVGSPQLAE